MKHDQVYVPSSVEIARPPCCTVQKKKNKGRNVIEGRMAATKLPTITWCLPERARCWLSTPSARDVSSSLGYRTPIERTVLSVRAQEVE